MNRWKVILVVFGTLLTTLACSSRDSNSQLPSPPVITTQPAVQTVTIGQVATFKVVVVGTDPLAYQWFWNGIAVSGATLDTFTTPSLVSSDNLSTLTVSVTNSVGTTMSIPAPIMIPGCPRPPMVGDLRFKDVDAFPVPLEPNQETNILGGMTATFPNAIGTPLELSGPGPNRPLDSSWSFGIFNLPTGTPERTTIYQSDVLSNFQSDFNSLPTSKSVIVSLDLCPGETDFAWEMLQTATSVGYLPKCQTMIPENLQEAATQEGAASRVITAISWNGGAATFISYGWQSDLSTIYDASVATATVDTVGTVATNLAQEGYILTAVGGNTYDGFMLVGTRVKGDNSPRPLNVWTSSAATTIGRGFSYVGHIFINNSAIAGNGTELWFLEQ